VISEQKQFVEQRIMQSEKLDDEVQPSESKSAVIPILLARRGTCNAS